MRLITIVGNRPQFVKAAAVSKRLREHHDEILVHTGQHYDDELSAIFFRELDLPSPDRELGVGSASYAMQVSQIMLAVEAVAQEVSPALGLVYGDTNSTLGGALACAKLGLPVAHVEAGMRSFDNTMPEERNRILTDHVSRLCLCSTETAVQNLRSEGITEGVHLVGDVMADLTLKLAPRADERSDARERLGLEPGRYLLVTAHRSGNVDDENALAKLVRLLEALPTRVVFPVHPRTRARLDAGGSLTRLASTEHVTLVPPLGYFDFLQLLGSAAAVLTDSGGVQKEAYLLRVPCLTLRETTEWVETVELGWNQLVGLDKEKVLAALKDLALPNDHPDLYGGGHAAAAVVDAIGDWAQLGTWGGRP